MKLLELPELAQQMIGDGRLALSSVEQLRAIGAVSPALLDALIAYLADGNEWAAERLTREPGWVLDSAMREGDSKVFAAHLGQRRRPRRGGAAARQEGRGGVRAGGRADAGAGPLRLRRRRAL